LKFRHAESRAGITAIGGVESVVQIMKNFPEYQALQVSGCSSVVDLTWSDVTGKKKTIESGGIEAALASVNNHLGSSILCKKTCWALGSGKNCEGQQEKHRATRLINLGGGAAVAKVRTNWPDNNNVQTRMRKLADLIAEEMEAWVDEE
jgi:hypothetical protein